jgi:hypothetical protein
MKLLAFTACFVFGLLGSLCAGPAISLEQAAKIASDYLRENGYADQHHISSLALQQSSLTRSNLHWYARFTPSVKIEDRVTTGVQIDMGGNVTRVVAKTTRDRVRESNRSSSADLR